ncbi:hypothetical protein ACW0JT_20435 [Arthrobacter sp. SA17]
MRAAGYPSPAQDYLDGRRDLNAHLIKDITSTYMARVSNNDGCAVTRSWILASIVDAS